MSREQILQELHLGFMKHFPTRHKGTKVTAVLVILRGIGSHPGFVPNHDFENLTEKTRKSERMLGSLIRKVEKNKKTTVPDNFVPLCLLFDELQE